MGAQETEKTSGWWDQLRRDGSGGCIARGRVQESVVIFIHTRVPELVYT